MTALPASRPPLVRPRRTLLAGVSAALAAHLGWSRGLVRTLFVLLTLLGGAGVLLYLWLWVFVPVRGEAGVVQRRLPVAAALDVLAVVAALTALVLARAATLPTPVVPGIVESVVLGGGAVAWSLVLDRRDPRFGGRYAVVVRTVAGCVLIVEGALLLPFQASPVTAVLGMIVLLIGVAVLVTPRGVAFWRGLIEERTSRDRESQRAEIAAHLHDSVLQTLAIIQNRAGPQSEVARLARAQERELRDWLFAGTDPFAGDVATELRTIAASLELEYPVRFDVVVVGEAHEVASAAIVGAGREAMLNAARHAGGDVSVYLEVSADAIDVFVRDRGPGFDPDAVAAGRMGIRESIVGRMERAGGVGIVRSTASGTEVELRLPLRSAAGRAA